MDSLTSALGRLYSSNSLKYLQPIQSSIQRVYVTFAANSDLCLSFIQRCIGYGEEVIGWRLPSIPLPMPLRVIASHELWERALRLQSEMTGGSVEIAASVQGLSSYQSTSSNGNH